MHRNFRKAGLIGLVVVSLVISGCSSGIPGVTFPVDTGQSGRQEAAVPERDPQAVISALRKLDPCALVDLDLVRSRGIPNVTPIPTAPHTCLLAPQVDSSSADGGIEITIGETSTQLTRFSGMPLSIGGARVYQYRDYASGSKRCRLIVPVSFVQAIEIRHENSRDADPCVVLMALGESAVAKLRNPDEIAVDSARRPVSNWDGCTFLVQLLGRESSNYDYNFGTARDPLSACETIGKRSDRSKPIQSGPKMQVYYGEEPVFKDQTRQISGKTVGVQPFADICKAVWNQGSSGTSVKEFGAQIFEITAENCDVAANLAEQAISFAALPPGNAGSAPQRPVIFQFEENDTGISGACADLNAADARMSCQVSREVEVPSDPAQILAGAGKEPNISCAVFREAVGSVLGTGYTPVTGTAGGCLFVDSAHAFELAADMNGSMPPRQSGRAESAGRQVIVIGGKQALISNGSGSLTIDLSPSNNLTRDGAVTLTLKRHPERGNEAPLQVKPAIPEEKIKQAEQIMAQVVQKYFP